MGCAFFTPAFDVGASFLPTKQVDFCSISFLEVEHSCDVSLFFLVFLSFELLRWTGGPIDVTVVCCR